MTQATVTDLVARALAAIHDDSPSYRALLQELSRHLDLPTLCAQPAAAELMQELRKLRPVGLWVRDRAQRALELKRDLGLDGAIGLISAADAPLLPMGRECWLVLPPDWDESLVRALPRGFGFVAPAQPEHALTSLRRVAPLRALGAICAEASEIPATNLDLLLLEANVPPSASRPEGGGARVLYAAESLERVETQLLNVGVSGLVCDGEQALSWAFRLATMRARAAL